MNLLKLLPLLVTLATTPAAAETVAEAARAIETNLGGRVGVMLRAPGYDPLASWRADEPFPMNSTFKAPLCGAVLARVDLGDEDLDRVIPYSPADLVAYSPVTEKRAGPGMTVGDLCAATITLSDNTAANLLLEAIDGPAGMTSYLRSIGDGISRLDRWETSLNEGRPGDPRDTSTPAQMADTLETLLFGNVLSDRSRRQLTTWMEQDQVADALIRASLPSGWGIADKTGAGQNGSRSIIAVIRTPAGDPWLATVYLTGNRADMATRNAAIARIGAAMVAEISAR